MKDFSELKAEIEELGGKAPAFVGDVLHARKARKLWPECKVQSLYFLDSGSGDCFVELK